MRLLDGERWVSTFEPGRLPLDLRLVVRAATGKAAVGLPHSKVVQTPCPLGQVARLEHSVATSDT